MLKRISPQALKWIFIFVATCCLIAVLTLPIGYYTLLRFITTMGGLLAIILLYQQKNRQLIYIFVTITILFNPFVPIYLQNRGIWIPLDIITGGAFLYLAFLQKTTKAVKKFGSKTSSGTTDKARVRDIIITTKEIT